MAEGSGLGVRRTWEISGDYFFSISEDETGSTGTIKRSPSAIHKKHQDQNGQTDSSKHHNKIDQMEKIHQGQYDQMDKVIGNNTGRSQGQQGKSESTDLGPSGGVEDKEIVHVDNGRYADNAKTADGGEDGSLSRSMVTGGLPWVERAEVKGEGQGHQGQAIPRRPVSIVSCEDQDQTSEQLDIVIQRETVDNQKEKEIINEEISLIEGNSNNESEVEGLQNGGFNKQENMSREQEVSRGVKQRGHGKKATELDRDEEKTVRSLDRNRKGKKGHHRVKVSKERVYVDPGQDSIKTQGGNAENAPVKDKVSKLDWSSPAKLSTKSSNASPISARKSGSKTPRNTKPSTIRVQGSRKPLTDMDLNELSEDGYKRSKEKSSRNRSASVSPSSKRRRSPDSNRRILKTQQKVEKPRSSPMLAVKKWFTSPGSVRKNWGADSYMSHTPSPKLKPLKVEHNVTKGSTSKRKQQNVNSKIMVILYDEEGKAQIVSKPPSSPKPKTSKDHGSTSPKARTNGDSMLEVPTSDVLKRVSKKGDIPKRTGSEGDILKMDHIPNVDAPKRGILKEGDPKRDSPRKLDPNKHPQKDQPKGNPQKACGQNRNRDFTTSDQNGKGTWQKSPKTKTPKGAAGQADPPSPVPGSEELTPKTSAKTLTKTSEKVSDAATATCRVPTELQPSPSDPTMSDSKTIDNWKNTDTHVLLRPEVAAIVGRSHDGINKNGGSESGSQVSLRMLGSDRKWQTLPQIRKRRCVGVGGVSARLSVSEGTLKYDNSMFQQRLIGAQNFDVIKFATYRTSCKLRFIQKKTNMFLVDIWNVIEAFRENGLNSFEPHAEVNVARLESLLTSVYYHLNKRLPTTSQINADYSLGLLINWLLSAYDPEGNGRIRVLSIKVALSTLCAGKLMDKLRYVFTQISDSNGYMVRTKFDEYLREVLTLPTAVFEGPSFGYNETAARACFGDKTKVNVNDFLDTLMSDPGPQCLMWLPILHRMAQVENVFHPVQCEGCHRESFMGFRYKCQRCYNYHLCQDCFWRGRVSGNHNNDHEVKEYSSYKSPAKQFGHSLRKSFRCVPASRSNHRIPRFPEQEQTLDLSHIVPATPVPSHNGFPETHSRSHSIDMSSLDTSSATQSPSKMHGGSIDSSRIDDEHRLIARYAARLAADANNASRSPTELNFSLDSNQAQRELIAQLEEKNRDILREIQRLRIEQEAHAKASPDPHQPRNPTLLAELRLLRQRRDELEGRMSALQESRRELMVQLEGLMKLLKSQGSPRSTPNSSPRSRTAHSPPNAMIRGSTPSTPGDSLVGVGGDVRQAFGGQQGSSASVHSLRNDLLVAADSVTNAMSSLVKELNSEASGSDDDEEDDDDDNNGLGFGRPSHHGQGTIDEMAAWREEMQQRLQQESEFIAQLRARRDSGQKDANVRYIPGADGMGTYITDGDDSYVKTDDESYMRTDEEDAELYDRDPKELFLQPRYLTDEESYLETDQESYIRTDDEDGGGTDWEETMRRWVNR